MTARSHPRRRAAALVLSLAAALAAPHPAAAAPDADLWPFWEPHVADGGAPVDHGAWQALLARYLVTDHPSGINRFRYDAVGEADRRRLDAYLAALQDRDPRSLSRDQQMAYWINLYNALTVALVLDHPEADGIREISRGLFSSGPWNMELAHIAGRAVTLNDIEHRILRPIFADPRIHFAVNCASLGCPDLQPRAFTAENLERLLDRGARGYVNHRRGVELTDRVLWLSSIFDWYREDFPPGREGLMGWLAGYAEPALASRLVGYEGRIRHRYDWRLNAPGVRWSPER